MQMIKMSILTYVLIRKKSIDEILIVCPQLKMYDQEYLVICKYCVKKEDIEKYDSKEKKIVGAFNIDKVEEPLDDKGPQPRSFSDFRRNVRRHFETITHKSKSKEQNNKLTKTGTNAKINSEAAIRCARICYYLYTLGRP